MTTLNVPLIRKGVDWVLEQNALADDHENRQWDQATWATLDRNVLKAAMAAQNRHDPMCGTSMCLAGFVAYITGWKFHFPLDLNYEGADRAVKDGIARDIPMIAIDELGITREQADTLFAPSNSAEDIQYYAEQIVEAAGDRL